jgi:hypothetical protein
VQHWPGFANALLRTPPQAKPGERNVAACKNKQTPPDIHLAFKTQYCCSRIMLQIYNKLQFWDKKTSHS